MPGSSSRAFTVAELRDHVAARDRGEGERLHGMVRDQVGAQPGIVVVHQMFSEPWPDNPLTIMAAVKQQPSATHDADIPDPEKYCARRLAMSLDAKLLAALIVLPHDRIKLRKPSALAIGQR